MCDVSLLMICSWMMENNHSSWHCVSVIYFEWFSCLSYVSHAGWVTCSSSSAFNLFTSAVTSIHCPWSLSVCLSAAYSPLCHFRVVWMRCRNLQISSFGPRHIRQDYPQAACGLSPCLSASSATAHQADRGAAHLTPAAFTGFSSASQPTKPAVSHKTWLLLSAIQ